MILNATVIRVPAISYCLSTLCSNHGGKTIQSPSLTSGVHIVDSCLYSQALKSDFKGFIKVVPVDFSGSCIYTIPDASVPIAL